MINRINKPFSQKKMGSFPFLGVLLNITIALSITGFLFLLLSYAGKLTDHFKEQTEVKIFLKREVKEHQKLDIEKALRDFEFVFEEENGNKALRFVSKEDAAKLMIERTGEDFPSLIGENPLPDAFFIRLKDDFHTQELLPDVLEQLRGLSGVMQVVYEEHYLQEITQNFRTLTIIFGTFALIFFAAAIMLIDNALRLALFSQRFLIRSMQLVGATPNFIKQPYLIRAAVQGAAGGLAAGILVIIMSVVLQSRIPELEALESIGTLVGLVFLLIGAGAIVSTGSVYVVTSRYLKMSLDDLY